MIAFCRPVFSCALAAFLMPAPGGLRAQLVAFDGFEEYEAGIQVEPGANGSVGVGLDGGFGWGGPYDVNRAIKSLVLIENRTASPVVYSNGGISLHGGSRALRFYNIANGSYAVMRPLGTVFRAAAGDVLWFGVLFRCNNASPLSNQDFFQVGFEDNDNAGNPRISIGANTETTTFPPDQPFRFFARSTTSQDNTAFAEDMEIAAATTFLLVGRVAADGDTYDEVSLYVDPSSPDDPGPPAARVMAASGLETLSHFVIRTSGLDNGDAYVIDELKVGRDYASVVSPPPLGEVLSLAPAASPEEVGVLRWPVSVGEVRLETSASLEPASWTEIAGPFAIEGADYVRPVPADPASTRAFFRLRR